MELIKDVGKFREESTVFLGDVKSVWNKATLLALSAVHYYVDKKDTVLIAELQNTFLNAGGNFSACFEAMVYATTNVKFRQNEDNLEEAVSCKTKGNMPEGARDILQTVEKEGLRRYEKNAKTKSRAASWNNDGQRKPRQSKSTDADVTSLKTTELGSKLTEAVKDTDKLSDEQKKAADKVVEQLASQLEAIKNGETLLETPAEPSYKALTPEQSALLVDIGIKMDAIAAAKGADSINGMLKSLETQVNLAYAKINKAIASLAEAS